MTDHPESQASNAPRTQEFRSHPRRKPRGLAYVDLAQDNGGMLLNLSEGGLAVQSAAALGSTDFPGLRFQLPHMQGWLRANGRVAWMNESKKEAGIQFLDLHEHARTQIRAWLENEESSAHESAKASARDEAPPAPNPSREASPPGQFAPYSLASRPRTSSPEPQSAPPRTERPMREELPGFRFNDYSMFSADPRASDLLVPAVRPKTRWAGYFLLILVLCALSFVSGIIVQQRGDVERLLAYVGVTSPDAPQPQVAQVATPPAGAPQPSAASPLTQNATPGETSSAQPPNDAQHPLSQQASSAEPAIPEAPKPAPEATPAAAAAASAPVEKPEPPASTATSSTKNKPAAPGGVENPAISASKPKTPKRSNPAAPAADTSIDHGPSILVSAPAPGSPPFWVNLPEESVNASPTVAITAKRSVQVPPRPEAGAARSERVIIGRLIAHSDPFYPLEARREKIEGSVTLQAVVGRTGQVLRVTPVSGPPVLTTAAVAALRDWRYEPTFIEGDPVETQAYVTMVFRAH